MRIHACFEGFQQVAFGNIPNGEVNKICSFVARKLGKLCFVSRNNDWSQSSA